jgi:hypothetical protein
MTNQLRATLLWTLISLNVLIVASILFNIRSSTGLVSFLNLPFLQIIWIFTKFIVISFVINTVIVSIITTLLSSVPRLRRSRSKIIQSSLKAWVTCTFCSFIIYVPLAISENDAVNAAPPDNGIGLGIAYLFLGAVWQILITIGTVIGTIAGAIKAYKPRPSQYLDHSP